MINSYPDLAKKVVIITGVASGIGYAQAKAFLTNGCQVFGLDKQTTAKITELTATFGSNFFFSQVDVKEEPQLEKFVKLVQAKCSRIDILLNTAGILDGYRPSLETPLAFFDEVIATNLRSVFILTNLVLPQMLSQKHGVIINMASIAGLVAGGGGAAYTTVKHGIIGYTKQLTYDYASVGIRANCIAPGAINTPMNAADFAGDGAMAKKVAALTPAKRWATPEEVANLSLFLASQSANYIHGSVLPIDGGWLVK